MRCTLGALVMLCGVSANVIMDTLSDSNDAAEAEANHIFMTPKRAKTFLKVRKRWNIKSLWGEEQEEESESRENGSEERSRESLARTCRSSCWGTWGTYSTCTKSCGNSGTQTSTRQRAPPSQCVAWVNSNGCPGSSTRSRPCNRFCQNGGTVPTSPSVIKIPGGVRPSWGGRLPSRVRIVDPAIRRRLTPIRERLPRQIADQPSCLCPTGYKGECCEERVTCGYPGKSTHGEVTPSGSTHNHGTVATFSCHTGYRLLGGATKTCQANGQWSGGAAPPTCQIVSCAQPSTPANGRRQGTTFTYGSHVVYTCNTGYNLVGQKTITCKANGQWSSTIPKCAAVTCSNPTKPSNGWFRYSNGVSGPSYRSVATFGCSSGYHMQGSSQRTCQVNGQWDGTQPTCQAITCPVLGAPSHGSVSFTSQQGSTIQYGGNANFGCVSGYTLNGPRKRTCSGSGPSGVWTGNQPTCQAVNCGQPSTPAHGTRIGNAFTFPNTVSFQCLPGYSMRGGTASLTCGSSGSWQGTPPGCSVCAPNTYKAGSNTASRCSSCPPHSHTIAQGSTAVSQCICNAGFKGPAGGPCTEILCATLGVPSHGTLGTCTRKVNAVCTFTCNPGYIRSKGDGQRSCNSAGTWTGTSPTCSACPKNTYRSTPTVCEVCPAHSQTVGEASELHQCICKPGFHKESTASTCQDNDECEDSNGGCEQTCENLPGRYKCTCTQTGYIQDAEDASRCVSKNQCPPLAEPDNGGLVCVAERRSSTERCSILCNSNYEHIDRTNAYEECGPSTNWMWTNQINESPILPCIEQFYTGVHLETEVAYFVDNCDSLNQAQLEAVKQQFIQLLNDRGICVEGGENVCTIDDAAVKCGALVIGDFGGFRKKRSTASELRIKFRIKARSVPKTDVNCAAYCTQLDIVNESCSTKCRTKYEEKETDNVRRASQKVQILFSGSSNTGGGQAGWSGSRPGGPSSGGQTPRAKIHAIAGTVDHTVNRNQAALTIGGLVLLPASSTLAIQIESSCDEGMEKSNDMCVPCPAGTFLSSGTSKCELCAVNTYQPQPQQTHCLPCPSSTTTSGKGNTAC